MTSSRDYTIYTGITQECIPARLSLSFFRRSHKPREYTLLLVLHAQGVFRLVVSPINLMAMMFFQGKQQNEKQEKEKEESVPLIPENISIRDIALMLSATLIPMVKLLDEKISLPACTSSWNIYICIENSKVNAMMTKLETSDHLAHAAEDNMKPFRVCWYANHARYSYLLLHSLQWHD